MEVICKPILHWCACIIFDNHKPCLQLHLHSLGRHPQPQQRQQTGTMCTNNATYLDCVSGLTGYIVISVACGWELETGTLLM